MMAIVPLEAFLTIAMPLAFFTRMKAPEVLADCMGATGNARAGSVASASKNNAIKPKRKRFFMFPPIYLTLPDGEEKWRKIAPVF